MSFQELSTCKFGCLQIKYRLVYCFAFLLFNVILPSSWNLFLEECLWDVNFSRTHIFLERREEPSFPWQWISRPLAVGWQHLSPPLSVTGRKSVISSLSNVRYCILGWNVLAAHICIGLFDILNMACSLKSWYCPLRLPSRLLFHKACETRSWSWWVLEILGKLITGNNVIDVKSSGLSLGSDNFWDWWE